MTQSPREEFLGSEDRDEAISQTASENGAVTDEAHGEAGLRETVELDITDPHFMADAYDTYADLRARGPVSRVRFARGEEEASEDGAEDPAAQFFRRETFFVTHYEEVIETLLDERFSVDPRSGMSPEQLEQQSNTPEEFQLIAKSIISIDPPDHKRLRKLVQPSFTGRGMEALRGSIQQI